MKTISNRKRAFNTPKNKSPKFASFRAPKPKLFFSVANETLNNFYALIHAVDLVNRYDGRYEISVAFNNPNLVTLAENVGWLGFTPSLISNAGNTRVISLTPSAEKVKHWEETDREDEYAFRVQKFTTVEPEKLAVPEIRYSEYIAILRDAVEIFDIELDHPLAILNEARNVKFLKSKKLQAAAYRLLQRNNIKSGAFTLVEKGFAGWNPETPAPTQWGRVITLPDAEDLLANEQSLLEYVGALANPFCAGIGVKSTDYVAAGVSSYRDGAPVIWDLRPSFAKPGEDLEGRLLCSLLIPDTKQIFAPNMDPDNIPAIAITRELAYVLSTYYNELKKVISQGKARVRVERPVTPPDFIWNLA